MGRTCLQSLHHLLFGTSPWGSLWPRELSGRWQRHKLVLRFRSISGNPQKKTLLWSVTAFLVHLHHYYVHHGLGDSAPKGMRLPGNTPARREKGPSVPNPGAGDNLLTTQAKFGVGEVSDRSRLIYAVVGSQVAARVVVGTGVAEKAEDQRGGRVGGRDHPGCLGQPIWWPGVFTYSAARSLTSA